MNINKFWIKVKKTSDCWHWIASKSKGYGNFKNKAAHRISYEIHYGKIPEKMCVCHKCDNPACVRPDHLFLGTVSDNNKDKASKNRAARNVGELAGGVKLTSKMVFEIRERAKAGIKQSQIAKEYKISCAQICRIVNYSRWSHI
jgi:hypothetical protein